MMSDQVESLKKKGIRAMNLSRKDLITLVIPAVIAEYPSKF